jgi:hypothetical protein
MMTFKISNLGYMEVDVISKLGGQLVISSAFHGTRWGAVHSAAVHSAFERADVLPCQICMAIYILTFVV